MAVLSEFSFKYKEFVSQERPECAPSPEPGINSNAIPSFHAVNLYPFSFISGGPGYCECCAVELRCNCLRSHQNAGLIRVEKEHAKMCREETA
jgi:hypothetical protein